LRAIRIKYLLKFIENQLNARRRGGDDLALYFFEVLQFELVTSTQKQIQNLKLTKSFFIQRIAEKIYLIRLEE